MSPAKIQSGGEEAARDTDVVVVVASDVVVEAGSDVVVVVASDVATEAGPDVVVVVGSDVATEAGPDVVVVVCSDVVAEAGSDVVVVVGSDVATEVGPDVVVVVGSDAGAVKADPIPPSLPHPTRGAAVRPSRTRSPPRSSVRRSIGDDHQRSRPSRSLKCWLPLGRCTRQARAWPVSTLCRLEVFSAREPSRRLPVAVHTPPLPYLRGHNQRATNRGSVYHYL